MRVYKLSFKNISENWRRSLTMGVFIFIVSLLLVLFNSFVFSLVNNLENAIINSLTGTIQVHSADSVEDDMFSSNGIWNTDIGAISKEEAGSIKKVLKKEMPSAGIVEGVRVNTYFMSESSDEAVMGMVFGINSESGYYKESVRLLEGEYLNADEADGIFLSKAQAEALKVGIGDEIQVLAYEDEENPVMQQAKVTGIGEVRFLAPFGFSVNYMPVEKARELSGLDKGADTDIILHTKNKADAKKFQQYLQNVFESENIDSVKLSVWEDMGGFVKSVLAICKVMFYSLMLILVMIVSILMINMIFMMGLERHQEIGTLRAIGFGKGVIVRIFMGEIMMIAVISGMLGIVTSSGIVLGISGKSFQVPSPLDVAIGSEFIMNYDVFQILFIFLLILFFTFLAAFYPAYKISSIRPAETLRES